MLCTHLAAFMMILISVFLVKVVFVDGIAKLTRELEKNRVHGMFTDGSSRVEMELSSRSNFCDVRLVIYQSGDMFFWLVLR
jgi:hypothetical protein